jgi:hypothetical protein
MAVRAAVCGSLAVQQCAVMCGSVRQCMYGSVRQCVAAVCGSAAVCASAHSGVHISVW